jgi:hypothetical protein
MTPTVLSPADRARLNEQLASQLARHPEVLFGVLHGSFLGSGPFRDLDVAVYLVSGAVEPDRMRGYECELAIEIESSIRKPVDVRVLNDAPLAFRYHALKGEPLMVRDGELFDEYRARTWDDYLDFQPFARRYLREALVE